MNNTVPVLVERVTVIGCGLIGGSFAKSLKSLGLAREVVGVDLDVPSLEEALRLGVVDRVTSDIAEGVKNSDLILIAVPVRQTVAILERLATLPLKKGCIVSDVCSTKREVCAASSILPSHVHFIGGHPMTGSEKSGVGASSEWLLQKAVYVLAPSQGTPPEPIERLSSIVSAVGAQPLILDPVTHDQVVAAISHIPHIVAAELVEQVAELGSTSPLYSRLAAGGFRDVTRIAAANPAMWRDVLLSNRDYLIELIDDWQKRMATVRNWLIDEDGDELYRLFERSRTWREALPVRASGAVRSALQCTVEVADEPGVIGRIATLLGFACINLRNIGILESREEETGQLILSFSRQQDLDEGILLLQNTGYKVHQKNE